MPLTFSSSSAYSSNLFQSSYFLPSFVCLLSRLLLLCLLFHPLPFLLLLHFLPVIVNTTSYIAPLVACHFYDASQERSLSVLYLILGITDQVQFQLFFESRKGFGFPNSCTSDLKGSIAHFSLGSWHENIRR